jgi:tetratricopeptide (TPR) repeat protein
MTTKAVAAALDQAERALAAVPDDPLRARLAALVVLSDRGLGAEAASVAERTVGLVERETGRLNEAGRRFRRAIAIAEAEGLAVRSVQARLSLVLVLLQGGDPDLALAELDRATKQAPRDMHGQLLGQRALIHIRVGRFDEALDDSRRALPLVRRAGDRLSEARVLSNRGILHAYRNELGLAETDLNKALALYRGLESEIAAAQVLHNLGYVSALKGDVPAALRRYDEAARPFAEQGLAAPTLSIDRAELLLSARLLPEARRQIEIGVAALEAAGVSLDLAEARLLLSQVALAEADFAVAGSAAKAAHRQLERQGRPRWAVLARFVEAQARWSAGKARARIPAEAGALAEALQEEGWLLPSIECRLLGARAALRAGDTETSKSLVAGIDARARSGPAALRVRVWYGEALGRLAAGNRSGALSALRSGLEVADEHRATLGATELRVRTATTVTELAALGLDLAFESKRAVEVLGWSERWRAGALRPPRVTPPTDERLAWLLSTLRDTVARLERVSLEGGDARPMVDQQRRIEAAIRQRSRGAAGDFVSAPAFPNPADLREAIGERALVEFVEHDGRLHAVVGVRRRFHLRLLGEAAEAATERATLQFALGRLALRRSMQPSLDAAAALLERSCRRLDELLIAPLERDLDGRDLVVVPTGELHALPWALLPSLRGRTMTVSPSVSLWYSRQVDELPRPRPLAGGAGAVVLVAGPKVVQAEDEISRIRSAFYPRARMLQGDAATARTVARAFEGRRLAHVAAHGTFRADNPQFSSLELADGPLTVYDLERIARPPEWMVLSACDAGRSEVHPGDELMGTSAALLSLGTRAIVSSVAPVPEDGVSPVMIALHAELARGHGLARALATAQARALPESLVITELASGAGEAREALAACAFVCLGAG